MLKSENLKKITFLSISIFLLLTLMFGRPFMGLYLYTFRIGEYLIGFSFFLLIYGIIFKRKFIIEKNSYFYFIPLSISTTFIFFAFFKNDDFLNPYVFRSSMYIWAISFILVGYFWSNNFIFKKIYIISVNFFLIYIYYVSVFKYPLVFSDFFKQYSDKFDYLKASEIILVFTFVTYQNKILVNSDVKNYLFILYSALYLPLFLIMSRGAALGLLLYLIVELVFIRKTILNDLIKYSLVSMLGILVFITSSFFIVEDKAIENEGISFVLQDVMDTKNTSTESLLSFYTHSNRLFSHDGNINFRLQIWQDVVNYSINGNVYLPKEGFTFLESFNGNEILIGSSYSYKIPAMNNVDYQGLDRSNESVHNYFVNIYARGGLIHLILLVSLFYFVFEYFKKKNKANLLNILVPLLTVAMFDAAMESPNYTFIFFFLIGTLFSEVKFINHEDRQEIG